MDTYFAETVLCVADFDNDFDAASSDYITAAKNFLIEAEEENVQDATIVNIEFLEFDSNNPSHAGAYFQVEYTGSKELYSEEIH